ncbi:MAG: hypothetical protein AAF607_04735 [Pseudomonadota bacterium]
MRLVELCQFYDPEEALVVRALLNAYGIPVFMLAFHHISAAPHSRIGLGGFRLLICVPDEADARRLINGLDHQWPECAVRKTVCPTWRPNYASAVFGFLQLTGFIHRHNRRRCPRCQLVLEQRTTRVRREVVFTLCLSFFCILWFWPGLVVFAIAALRGA